MLQSYNGNQDNVQLTSILVYLLSGSGRRWLYPIMYSLALLMYSPILDGIHLGIIKDPTRCDILKYNNSVWL